MKGTVVASRYAKSLLGLAIEQNKLEEAYADMLMVAKTVNENRDLELLLKSPVVKTDKKQAILDQLFGSKISPISSGFFKIITTKRREYLIGQIANSFVQQYKFHNNIITAEITSAVKLDANLKKKVLQLVKSTEQEEVEVVERIDESLIGGIIVRIGDKQVDASILRQINDLKKDFSKNPYIAEI
jgi:F-type H+-transporting ATPase subunit delta